MRFDKRAACRLASKTPTTPELQVLTQCLIVPSCTLTVSPLIDRNMRRFFF
jgi:hypothetical protein